MGVREAYSPLDISSSGCRVIIIKKPVSGTEIRCTGSLVGDGTDGKMYYVTKTGDLDEVGIYNVQGYLELGMFSGFTTPTTFVVNENL